MGFETEAEKQSADRAKAPLFFEGTYRLWLLCLRNEIDSELIGEARAAEWAKTLPRLEEDYKRFYRQNVDKLDIPDGRKLKIRDYDEMPEVLKLQMLKDFVVDSMMREGVESMLKKLQRRDIRLQILGVREEEDKSFEEEFKKNKSCAQEEQSNMHNMKSSLIAIGTMLLTGVLILVCGFLVPGAGMSWSESLKIACWQSAMVIFFTAALVIRGHLRDFGGTSRSTGEIGRSFPLRRRNHMDVETLLEESAADRAKRLLSWEEDHWWRRRTRKDVELIAEKQATAWAEILPDLEEDYRQALEDLDTPKDLKLVLLKKFKVPEELRLDFLKKLLMPSEAVLQGLVRRDEHEGEVRLQILEDREDELNREKKSSMPPRKKSLIAIGTMLSTASVLLISGFLYPGMSLSKSFQIVCWQTATVSFFAAGLAIWDHLRVFARPDSPFGKPESARVHISSPSRHPSGSNHSCV